MGANIGTTVTAQILRLGGLSGDNLFLLLLRPEMLGPIFAFVGIMFYSFFSGGNKRTWGQIFLGLGLLFMGIKSMETALTPHSGVEAVKGHGKDQGPDNVEVEVDRSGALGVAAGPDAGEVVSDLLHALTDFERIGDYAVNLSESASVLSEQKLSFSGAGLLDDPDRRVGALPGGASGGGGGPDDRHPAGAPCGAAQARGLHRRAGDPVPGA